MNQVRFQNLSMKYQLFVLFLILLIFPFAVYSGIIISQNSAEFERVGSHSAVQVLRQTGQFVENRVETVKRALDFITLDETVRSVVDRDPAAFENNLGQWIVDATSLRKIVVALKQNNPDIASFTMYMYRGLGSVPAADESPEFRPMNAEFSSSWYQRMASRGNAFGWFAPVSGSGPGSLYFRGIRKIPDDRNLHRTIGFIRADVPVEILRTILNTAEFSPSSMAYLINSYGELVAVSDRAQKVSGTELSSFAGYFPATNADREMWKSLDTGKDKYLTGMLPIETTDWRMMLIVPYRDIYAFGDGARNQMLLALVIIAPLTLPLAFIVASGSTRRLSALLSGVHRIRSGTLDVRLPNRYRDEVGELTDSFNDMVGRIRDSLTEQYRLGQSVQRLELKALQAQINPHFLYNTLDLVNCLAIQGGNPKISEAIEGLSKFYRLSLSGGEEEISLAQEVDLVAAYVSIQNMRFDGGIELAVDLPPEILSIRLPKLLLQPLVENAILHGIRERDDERGRITISGRFAAGTDAEAILVVEDNGVGMDAARLADMMRGFQSSDGHGYGVHNIIERIKLRFGPNYGLEYESRPGQGTKVMLRLPVDVGEPETVLLRDSAEK